MVSVRLQGTVARTGPALFAKLGAPTGLTLQMWRDGCQLAVSAP
jgi:hypothetical protein